MEGREALGKSRGSLRARLSEAGLPAVLLAFGLVMYLLAGDIQFAERPGQLGPQFWPQMLMVLLMCTAAGIFLTKLRSPVPSGRDGTVEEASWGLLTLGGALVVGYVVLSVLTGFLVSTSLFMMAFLYAAGYRRWTVVPLSLVAAFLMVLLFVRVVYVSLPTGIGIFDEFTTVIYAALGIY